MTTTTQPLFQVISTSIKKELDVDTFLQTLTVESIINHLKQFALSGWFLLKVLGAVIFLLASQTYKLGQQTKVYFQPSLISLANKVYNNCKPINNPVTQFIAGLLTPTTTPLTDKNGNPFTIRIQTENTENHTTKSMGTQEQQITHPSN